MQVYFLQFFVMYGRAVLLLGSLRLRCFCCVFKTALDEHYIHVSGFDIFINNKKQHENGRGCWGAPAFRGQNVQQKLQQMEWVFSFTKQLQPWELAAGHWSWAPPEQPAAVPVVFKHCIF